MIRSLRIIAHAPDLCPLTFREGTRDLWGTGAGPDARFLSGEPDPLRRKML
jgi:hypothetical protein